MCCYSWLISKHEAQDFHFIFTVFSTIFCINKRAAFCIVVPAYSNQKLCLLFIYLHSYVLSIPVNVPKSLFAMFCSYCFNLFLRSKMTCCSPEILHFAYLQIIYVRTSTSMYSYSFSVGYTSLPLSCPLLFSSCFQFPDMSYICSGLYYPFNILIYRYNVYYFSRLPPLSCLLLVCYIKPE